jgi:hypothetical protein
VDWLGNFTTSCKLVSTLVGDVAFDEQRTQGVVARKETTKPMCVCLLLGLFVNYVRYVITSNCVGALSSRAAFDKLGTY